MTGAAVVGAGGDGCGGMECPYPEQGLLCSLPAASEAQPRTELLLRAFLPGIFLRDCPWCGTEPGTPLLGCCGRCLLNDSKTWSSAPSVIFYCQRCCKGLNIECSQSFCGYCRFCLCLVQGCGAAGSYPSLALAAISLLSQSLDRESTPSIWDAMRPSFLVYSSWQANPCVMQAGAGSASSAVAQRQSRPLPPCPLAALPPQVPAAPLPVPPEGRSAPTSRFLVGSQSGQHVWYLSSAR